MSTFAVQDIEKLTDAEKDLSLSWEGLQSQPLLLSGLGEEGTQPWELSGTILRPWRRIRWRIKPAP